MVAEGNQTQVCFSNVDYYTRMEELKRTHLQNIVELERMYMNQHTVKKSHMKLSHQRKEREESHMSVNSIQLDGSLVTSRHVQSTISQQELRIGSKKNSVTSSTSEVANDGELRNRWRNSVKSFQQRSDDPSTSSAPKKQTRPPRSPSGGRGILKADSSRRNAKVTVPRPFKMMLREEEKKRRNMKTRSEVELENMMLKKELEELRECGKKFRATPAPPHTRLSLCEVISQHPKECRRLSSDHGNCRNQYAGGNRCSRRLSLQPFSFIERERRKRERKLDAALRPEEEHKTFKARPVPRSLYRGSSREHQQYEALERQTKLQRHNKVVPRPVEILREEENDASQAEEGEEQRDGPTWRLKKKPSLVDLEPESRKSWERDWTYIHPIWETSVSCNSSLSANQGLQIVCKNDYISV
uniref:Protein FAM161A n=2 Tax=Denticeps clupeoides TaxID=299321 RepID=A0AAY4DN77_9TELE